LQARSSSSDPGEDRQDLNTYATGHQKYLRPFCRNNARYYLAQSICGPRSPSFSRFRPARHRNELSPGWLSLSKVLTYRSLLKRPYEIFAMTVRAWRRAEAAVIGWPKVSVSIPDRRRQWVFRWDRFPISLRQDCQAWCDRLAGRDLMEDTPFRPVRPVTVAHREWQIRSFASALVRRGRDPAMLTSEQAHRD
jgi:hypothetical protein